MTVPTDETLRRIREAIEREIEQIKTPEAAEAVLDRIEDLTQGETEQQAGDAAAREPEPAAAEIEQAAAIASPAATAAPAVPAPVAETAAVLTEAGAEAVAPTPEAPVVVEAAQSVLSPTSTASIPAVERGRELLRAATLHRLSPLDRLDARLYLAVNRLPHPPALDRLANLITATTVSGWIWILAVAVAALFRVGGSRRALGLLLPCVWGATWVVEYPIKAMFRRRRPFLDVVRAFVVGKKPGSWSFPSGHTAASFATAWILSTVWRRGSPAFFAVAATVGFSRVYAGAHYPGDVATGALMGTVFSEAIRRLTRLLWTPTDPRLPSQAHSMPLSPAPE